MPVMSSRSGGYRGVVVTQLPDALFTIQLDDSNRRIVAHVDGSPRRNFVRHWPGDRVTVEWTSQNWTRGRITCRTGVTT